MTDTYETHDIIVTLTRSTRESSTCAGTTFNRVTQEHRVCRLTQWPPPAINPSIRQFSVNQRATWIDWLISHEDPDWDDWIDGLTVNSINPSIQLNCLPACFIAQLGIALGPINKDLGIHCRCNNSSNAHPITHILYFMALRWYRTWLIPPVEPGGRVKGGLNPATRSYILGPASLFSYVEHVPGAFIGMQQQFIVQIDEHSQVLAA